MRPSKKVIPFPVRLRGGIGIVFSLQMLLHLRPAVKKTHSVELQAELPTGDWRKKTFALSFDFFHAVPSPSSRRVFIVEGPPSSVFPFKGPPKGGGRRHQQARKTLVTFPSLGPMLNLGTVAVWGGETDCWDGFRLHGDRHGRTEGGREGEGKWEFLFRPLLLPFFSAPFHGGKVFFSLSWRPPGGKEKGQTELHSKASAYAEDSLQLSYYSAYIHERI